MAGKGVFSRSSRAISTIEIVKTKMFEVKDLLDELPISEDAKEEAFKIIKSHCQSAIKALELAEDQ